MASLNKATIIGHLGKDPETRYLPSGDAVANFSVATSERWKDKTSGEDKEATEWHRVNAFGKLAEIAGEYLKKGSQVYVEGQLRTRKWTDKDGVERYSTEIRMDKLVMLNRPAGERGGDDREERPARNAKREEPARGARQADPKKPAGKFDDLEDDIPF